MIVCQMLHKFKKKFILFSPFAVTQIWLQNGFALKTIIFNNKFVGATFQ